MADFRPLVYWAAPHYGCFVAVEDGAIFTSPMVESPDGEFRLTEDWCEVTEPCSQAFLDEVNYMFDTEHIMADFGMEPKK